MNKIENECEICRKIFGDKEIFITKTLSCHGCSNNTPCTMHITCLNGAFQRTDCTECTTDETKKNINKYDKLKYIVREHVKTKEEYYKLYCEIYGLNENDRLNYDDVTNDFTNDTLNFINGDFNEQKNLPIINLFLKRLEMAYENIKTNPQV